ncbi:hypothetical protein SBRCBS47491_006803 [Sporothrix bragantina]|uniref:Transmembrane protein 42 n=1 Tax=Sporothrix bragantina TaxID=671064 RepID=A0ABP0CAG3_9PEZI
MDSPSVTDNVPLMDQVDGSESINDTPDAPLPATGPSGTLLQRNQWIGLALASGACAAFNGVFAKLTTTELTTKLSHAVARSIGLDSAEGAVEVAVRGAFFVLNLIFNGVMWTLFTRALKAGHSATQVSIMNTSANFVLTALLGLAIFSESLPPLWWAGATMLVAGNVIIGRKDEGSQEGEESRDDSITSLPDDEADEAAVAATTVSAAAAAVGAGHAGHATHAGHAAGVAGEAETDAETQASKGRRTSRRLAAQQHEL